MVENERGVAEVGVEGWVEGGVGRRSLTDILYNQSIFLNK
jgi:hypothetical protein